MAILDGDLRVLRANEPFVRRFGRGIMDGQTIYDAVDGRLDRGRLKVLLEELLSQDSRVERYDLGKDKDDAPLLGFARRVPRDGREAASILLGIQG